MLQTVTLETQAASVEHLSPLRPVGAVAATVARLAARPKARPILYVARNSSRAREIHAVLSILTGPERTALLPRWDGYPADGVAPSATAVGKRMSLLRWLLNEEKRPAAVVTTAAALMRRVPPRRVWQDIHIEFRVGDSIEIGDVEARLARIGYVLDERCDEPGEAAIHGSVIEFFPAAAPRPCRIEHEDGIIRSIRSFDPVTQRSVAGTEHLIVDPASERVGELGDDARNRSLSLAELYGEAETLFDYLPDAEIVLESEADRSASAFHASLEDTDKRQARDFLTDQEWETRVAERLSAVVEEARPSDEDSHVPLFASRRDALTAVEAFAEPLREQGYRIVLAAPKGGEAGLWSRRLARLFGTRTARADDWGTVLKAEPGALLRLEAEIAEGFVAHEDKVVVLTLRHLAGQSRGSSAEAPEDVFRRNDELFGIGDAVVHIDHGVGILEGLETVGDEIENEAIRLRFADDATLLVPLHEIGALWRYGGEGTEVSLDKLKGDSWIAKRNRIVGEIATTAGRMVERLKEKDRAKAKPLQPDRVAFERFCERFAHDLTPGQGRAVDAILADLRSGRPMDRLLCGDVGFGKTEVALRAVAAAALSGRQVAVVAPTTVLARQHFETFAKRFARDGIEIALLSRLQSSQEARDIRERLADGRIRVLVATHAVCGKDVAFDDLALVVIDEEQRFGSRHKETIRKLAPDLHVLSMTATPIPRTLQAGFVGLHDISVIETPPVRRRPIRTRTVSIEDEAVRDALLAEKARGGQSYVVCPRIEDIAPMAERLAELAPNLSVAALHGEMAPAEVEQTMIDFAGGKGDVLLATNIIESGLDVTAANTMIVYRPDRFGLAQLHQLRGRVGRGVRRGTVLLATEPEAELTDAARQRLETLERLTALGSGFDISARDLDMRGAGELLGDEQAGHLQLIGLSLYRRTLERALKTARGEDPGDDWRCELNIGIAGTIPADHVPEPELRLELAVALDRAEDEVALTRLRTEITDRFGPIPSALDRTFRLAALRLRATTLGIRRLDAGPKAVAATFSLDDSKALKKRIKPRKGSALRWSELRLISEETSDSEDERWAAIEALLDRIA